ncbi:MAG TPA: hypothetical protein VNH84_22320 [Candidatus Saccharimonadales bacterium]|nr:hypothetical protein [Candidatus Saccharimonadales bacterium]
MTSLRRVVRRLRSVCGAGWGCVLAWALVIGWSAAGFSAHAATEHGSGLWWKGNLHTHTFWSDGDDFPESVVDWYKSHGYHFLALSDHNVVLGGEKWLPLNSDARRRAWERYLARFGSHWAEQRTLQSTQMVRLKTLEEFRRRFEERRRFLLIPSEEISDQFESRPLHLNATHLRDLIRPQGGSNVTDVLQRTVDAVLAQRKRTGQVMFPHVNHPNFNWAITAEDMMPVRGERFFEVYNGHPEIHNQGDEYHASVERIWDILLAFRLAHFHSGPLYGLAVDDAHSYHSFVATNSNPGRGWIMVRAPRLQTEALLAAMEAGDFYASTGVVLRDVQRSPGELRVEIEAEPGVRYTTEFLGTLRGFDPTSRPGMLPQGSSFPVTREYSSDIGLSLAVVEGPLASYRLRGDELYVRAKVVSSKPKTQAIQPGEREAAWTQPVVAAEGRGAVDTSAGAP